MDDKTVGDLMLPLEEYATIREGCTIGEALAVLSKSQLGLTYDRHQHRAVLVLNRVGEVVGKLTHLSIIRSLDTDLLREGDRASLARAGLSPEFVNRLIRGARVFSGSLTRMARTASRVRVEDAMVPVGEGIERETPVGDAIRQMALLHAQSLIVLDRGKAVGIIRLSDVFEEVADLIRQGDSG